MRRTIGKRLLESTQQLPHFYATAEINMGESEISRRDIEVVDYIYTSLDLKLEGWS
jgi:pyruvate/2-oxoglutarate dehydrogenase complex dihydrolipoamide acyltransferase (E2) component